MRVRADLIKLRDELLGKVVETEEEPGEKRVEESESESEPELEPELEPRHLRIRSAYVSGPKQFNLLHHREEERWVVSVRLQGRYSQC